MSLLKLPYWPSIIDNACGCDTLVRVVVVVVAMVAAVATCVVGKFMTV